MSKICQTFGRHHSYQYTFVALSYTGLFPVLHPRAFLTAITDNEELKEVIVVSRHRCGWGFRLVDVSCVPPT